jgi:general secretion pathway protein G
MARYRTWSEVPPAGFTILELLVVTVIIGTLSSMVAPSIQRARENAQVAAAVVEIRILEAELMIYREINFEFPVSLAAIDRAGMVDPWGFPYVYAVVTGPGGARKDKFMVPLNTDFDLYSVGQDGASAAPLSASTSQDDILRALNGAWVGLGSDF